MEFSLTATAQHLETIIRANRLLDMPSEFLFPAYNGLSLPNVVQTIGNILGLDMPNPLDDAVWGGATATPYGNFDRVILMVSDGLGYLWLQQLVAQEPEFAELVFELTEGRGMVPLTSVAPTTTAVALPTFWTGVTPGTHGMLGTQVWLREASMLAQMLHFKPAFGKFSAGTLGDLGIVPEQFIPVPTLGERLTKIGVESHLFLQKEMIDTGLSRIMHRGVTHKHQHRGFSDFWLRFHDVIAETRGKRAYIHVYHPGVDSISHVYGAHNRYIRHEIHDQLSQLRQLLRDPALQDGRTLVIVMADHGHYDIHHELTLTEQPAIYRTMRSNSGGEGRLPYLYISQGRGAELIETLRRDFAEGGVPLDGMTAIEAGLFGEANHPEVPHRVGDVIFAMHEGWLATDHFRQNKHFSRHGGLSQWEMLVPFLWRRI